MNIPREEYLNEKLTFNEKGIYYRQFEIMGSWEKDYIKKYIRKYLDLYKPKIVLEIGFGLGYTADEIQSFGVDKHIIVEAHPEVFKNAQEWAKDKNVQLIYGFIEDVELPEVDFIWDDRHDLTSYGNDFLKRIKHKHYHDFDVLECTEMNVDEYLKTAEEKGWQ